MRPASKILQGLTFCCCCFKIPLWIFLRSWRILLSHPSFSTKVFLTVLSFPRNYILIYIIVCHQKKQDLDTVLFWTLGFPGGSEFKASAWNAGDWGLIPGSGRSPGEGKWQPTPVLLPGKSLGGRSLVANSPWGCKESDTTEWLIWSEAASIWSCNLSQLQVCVFFLMKYSWCIM